MDWYIKVLKNYVGFSGRARRKEYWMFALISTIISIVLAVVDAVAGLKLGGDAGIGILGTLYSLAVLLPALAVSVRRLHDIGKSGWWILVGLIPCVGIIWLIILYATEGNAGPNEHGDDPKAAERGAYGGGAAA